MNSPVIGLRVASVIFGLAGVAHLIRLLAEMEIVIAGHHLPMWLSGVAVVVAGILCGWLWKLTLPAKTPGGTPEHTPSGHPA